MQQLLPFEFASLVVVVVAHVVNILVVVALFVAVAVALV